VVPVAAPGFHPNYTTKYDINRETQTWSQTLTFQLKVQDVDLNSSTTISIGKDTSLDRDQRNNQTTLSLGYNFNPDLTLSGQMGITRNLTEDSRSRSVLDSDRFTGKLQYRRVLPAAVNGVFAVDFGTQQDTRESSLLGQGRESTGPFGQVTADFDFTGAFVNWTTQTRYRNSQQRSVELETGTVTNDRNRDADLGMTFNLTVPGLDTFALTLQRNESKAQQPFLQGGLASQDNIRNINRGFTVDAGVSPWSALELKVNAGFRNNDVNREIDTQRSQESIDSSFNGDLAWVLPDSSRLTAKLDFGRQRSVYDDTTRVTLNGNTETRAFGGTYVRSLGQRADFNASGSYQIQSYLFDDTVNNTDDRDVVRADLAGTANYSPWYKIDTMLRLSFEHNQTIFIDGSKSSGNSTQQTYVINPVFIYQITPWLLFREDASAVAVARVFDFNEDNNKLNRSTDFRTSIESQLHRRLDMTLRHVHRTILDGSYALDPEDGVRKFSKSSEQVTQDLTLRLDYVPMSGSSLYFRTFKQFRDTISRVVQGGDFVDVTTTSEFTEIELGGTLNYTLRNGLSTAFKLRRLQNWTKGSNTRTNYFVGDLTITYKF
jgi:hypothetical protein